MSEDDRLGECKVRSNNEFGSAGWKTCPAFAAQAAQIADLQALKVEMLAALDEYASGYLVDEFENPALCYDDAHRAVVVKVFAAIAKARGTA